MVIWTIAKTTFGEAMRKKILNIFIIVAIALMILAMSFPQLGFKQDLTTVKSLGLLVILVTGFVISVTLSVSLIPNEVDRRTIYTILSKPVNRYEFIIGKFLGGLLTLFVNIFLIGVVFMIMITIKAAMGGQMSQAASQVAQTVGAESGEKVKAGIWDNQLLLGIVLIYFQFALLSAVSVFFSIFMTPTVNFFASAGVWIVGSASGALRAIAETKSDQLVPFIKYLYFILSRVIPNFDYYNVQNKLIHPHTEARSLPMYVAFVIAYSVVFSLVLMIIGVLSFDKREV